MRVTTKFRFGRKQIFHQATGHGEFKIICFLPIMMEVPPAPHNLLKLIRCNCTKECRGHCSCFKHSLKCTAMCGECRGVSCCNDQDIIMDDVDIDTKL